MSAIEKNLELDQLSLADFQSHSSLIEEDVYNSLSLVETLRSKSSIGGTAPDSVNLALKAAGARLAK